jgi:hypothetical protein
VLHGNEVTLDALAVHQSQAAHNALQREVSAPQVIEEAPVYLANPLSRLRFRYREYIGEFLGTMTILIFGNGVNCQVVLSELTQGNYLSISFGWGIGVM